MTAHLLRRWTAHADAVEAIALRSDGRLLASGSHDGSVCLWEWRTGNQIGRWALSSSVSSVAFSPDASQFVVGGEGAIWVCMLRASQPSVYSIPCPGAILSVAFRPDGLVFASGGMDGMTRLWNPLTRQPLATLPHDDGVRCVAFRPDGHLLATATQGGSLLLWEAQTGRELACVLQEAAWISSIAFSPDGRWLACGVETGELVVIALETGQVAWRCLAHHRPVLSVAFSPDSTWVVSGGGDAAARLWSSAEGKSVPGQITSQQAITGVVCAPLQEVPGAVLLATGSRDATVGCWSLPR